MAVKVTAVNIAGLWYGEPSTITEDLTGAKLAQLLKTYKQVENIHQDTWTIEESEASQDTYKNQLTRATYRMGAKQMGDVTFNWTIGQYDYETKAAFMGGTATETSWKRSRGVTDVNKVLVAKTEDGQYCVLPKASISGREALTDGAIGIAVKGTMLEPNNINACPEYWFDESELKLFTTCFDSLMKRLIELESELIKKTKFSCFARNGCIFILNILIVLIVLLLLPSPFELNCTFIPPLLLFSPFIMQLLFIWFSRLLNSIDSN